MQRIEDAGSRQRSRATIVADVVALEAAFAAGMSQRAFAEEQRIPRSSLQHWQANKDAIDASPALVAFFERSEGLAFQHRLVP